LIHAQEELAQFARRYWKRGVGVGIDINVGATFGIPIGVDGGGYLYMYRVFTESDDDVVIKLIKRGYVEAGLDVGVGAGFSAGLNKKKWLGPSIGAEAGAHLEVKGRLLVHEEYEFPLVRPISNDEDFNRRDLGGLALLASFAGPTSNLVMSGLQLLGAFGSYNINPSDYLVDFKIHVSAFGNVSAIGSAGIRFGQDDYSGFWTSVEEFKADSGDWNDPDDPAPGGNPKNDPKYLQNKYSKFNWRSIVQKILSISGGINGGAELVLGFEMQKEIPLDNYNQYIGLRMPEVTTCKVLVEFEAFTNTSIPLLLSLIHISEPTRPY